jgi:hypothetical protein
MNAAIESAAASAMGTESRRDIEGQILAIVTIVLRTADEPVCDARHSHSIVPGGFDVMSYATRFTPATSLMIRCDIVSNTS